MKCKVVALTVVMAICLTLSLPATAEAYSFTYKTAIMQKTWFNGGYEMDYYFSGNVRGKTGKMVQGSLSVPIVTDGKERVGRIALGKYVKNGFLVVKQMNINNQKITIKIDANQVCFYWYLEGNGIPVKTDYVFNWESLFKGRILSPEGIYATPINGYDTSGFFLTPSLHWEWAVLTGNYGGKNVWLNQNAGWAFYYYPQLVSMIYTPLISTKGVMYTKPTSAYLKNLYEFGGSFYDTRFNADCADFLTQVGKAVGEPAYIWAARKHETYFINHASAHSWKIGEGILVSDYSWEKMPDRATHASLNHNLAEVNFLLKLGDAAGLAVAQKILTGIMTSQDSWIASNGDLNYAYYGDSYRGKDYETLTLNDLLETQSLLSQYDWGSKYGATIDYLIVAKEKYLGK